MTVLVGQMQLPVTQDADRVRDYLNGTIADGGLWTALTRASDHDHTGGLNGKPISVASIPDGSITTSKLDPSVLLPYALVDASKPFTGQVTMNGDAIVRNTLYFGAKPAGVADVTLQRTGAGRLRLDTNLGVGVAPAAWASRVGVQIGNAGALGGDPTGTTFTLASNSYYDGANKAIVTGAGVLASLSSGSLSIFTAPSVAAGAGQTFTARAALAPTGTLTLTPDVGQSALAMQAGGAGTIWYLSPAAAGFQLIQSGVGPRLQVGPTGTLTLTPDAGATALSVPSLFSVAPVATTTDVQLTAPGASAQMRIVATALVPFSDAFVGLGSSAIRWASVWASSGVVSGSSFDQKHDLSPLDPAACAQAVLDTDWISFVYNDPPQPEGEQYAEAYQKMLAETAPARHQNGYVLGSPDHKVSDLFGLSDRRSKSDGADLAIVACALQDALKRLATLEGARA